MTIEEIKTEITKFETEYKEKRNELVSMLSKEFAPLFTSLFEKYPKIKTFAWTQYTPSWNDGEECYFSANFDYPTVNGWSDNYGQYLGDDEENFVNIFTKCISGEITEENLAQHIEFNNTPDGYRHAVQYKVGEEGYFPNPDYDQYTVNGMDEFKKVLESISKEFYEDLFGDGKEITLFSNGTITVEDYEHD